ncbi:Nucleoid occlusion protein [bioreactor metagenome]|uniref:Nucleoid occlusion protein n=1 Tax=bioreactor metagenome TaxID=1076179 RepID=A0A644SYI3_9ZZZZ|nr:nucleoid occlusion protein [Negativicutes bacterium]
MKNLARLFGFPEGKSEENNPADDTRPEHTENTGDSETSEVDIISLNEVRQVNVDNIVPNPFQPRKTFNEDSLKELAASITEFGVIQPLLVRKTESGLELIAGERRLRASRLAGLTHVPVILKELNDQEMAELAMIENLQREDLHYLEEAEGYQALLNSFGFTQDVLAKRVGKTQSTIANKLRLLKLDSSIRKIIVDESLTERHARALLKLNDLQIQMQILNEVREKKLNVRETEGLIEEVLADISREMTKKDNPKRNVVKIIKDVRIFLNSINKVVGEMKKTGLKIKIKQDQDDDYITINLRIPKRR